MPQTNIEKIQPWKAGWLARNNGAKDRTETKGTSHGAAKGQTIITGGFTSGVSIKMTTEKAQ